MNTLVAAAIAALFIVTLGYRVRVRRHPFKNCRHCDGYGRTPAGIRGTKRKACRKCGGHGVRRRLWRAPANHTRAVLRDAFDQPGRDGSRR